MRYLCAVILLVAAGAPAAVGATFISGLGPAGTATYNGYYAWGSGSSWVWYAGGYEAHYYSDCYPCGFWDNSSLAVEFRLPNIAGNLIGASLNLYVTAADGNYDSRGGAAADLYYYAYNSSWTGDAYADRSAFGGTTLIQSISGSSSGWISLPVTDAVAGYYASGATYSAFRLAPTGTGYDSTVLGFSADQAAYLSVVTDAQETVPEPAGLGLLGLGMCWLLGLRLYRRV